MEPSYEIEFRGPLSPERRIGLETFLATRGVFKDRNCRKSYVFSRSGKNTSFRVRQVGDHKEILLKHGADPWARWKHTIGLSADTTPEEVVYFFSLLGFPRGAYLERDYTTYYHQGLKFVLASVKGAARHDYFEIEGNVKHKGGIPKLKAKILKMMRRLRLRPFTKKEYTNLISELNKFGPDKKFFFDFKKKAIIFKKSFSPKRRQGRSGAGRESDKSKEEKARVVEQLKAMGYL